MFRTGRPPKPEGEKIRRGDKRKTMKETGWLQDSRIYYKGLVAKLVYEVLWDTARDEMVECLPARFWSHRNLVRLVGSNVTVPEIEKALAELMEPDEDGNCLIAKQPDGSCKVRGIKKIHAPLTSWKDGVDSKQIESNRKTSNVVQDVTVQDVTVQNLEEVSSAPQTRVSDSQKESPKSERIDYQRVMDWWNKLAEELGLAKITSIKNRKDLIRNKLVNDEAFADLDLLAGKIREQPFLRGEGPQRWRLAFTPLFKRKDMATSIMDLEYLQGKEPPKPKTKNSEWDGVPPD